MASAPTALYLVQQTRRYLRDWKAFDLLNASITASGTSLTVSDTTIYARRWPVEIDQELMMITSLASSTQLLVNRPMFGTTAVSHASSAQLLIRPDFYAIEILDALNEAIMACFPAIYKAITDTSQVVATNTYSYTIPDMPGYTGWPIPFVNKVEILQPGDFRYRGTKRFQMRRGTSASGSVTSIADSLSPAVVFKSLPPVGSQIRISGWGPCQPLANINDTLDSLFPPQAWYLLPLYAAGSLLMSGEAGRVRYSTGAVDTREEANRVGASLQAGLTLLNRFRNELLTGAASSAMPPMPRHARSNI